MRKSLIGFVATAFLATSCILDNTEYVDQESIFTTYTVDYLDNLERTKAEATFTLAGPNGRKLELSQPAFVSFNDELLEYHSISKTYVKSFHNKIENPTFEYTNLDDNTFTQNIGTIDSIGFPESNEIIKSDNVYEFIWQGEPLTENETVTLSLRTSPFHFQIHAISDVGASSINIKVEEMEKIHKGKVYCKLERIANLEFREDDGSKSSMLIKRFTQTGIITIE